MRRRTLPLFLLIAITFAFELRLHSQTISGITPSSATAGSSGFVIAISGSGFSNTSVVQLTATTGVHVLQSYFVNTNLLLAGVTSIEIANPELLKIDVANYATHTSSNAVTLSVLSAGSSGGSGSSSSGGSGASGGTTGIGSGSGGSTGSIGSGSGGTTGIGGGSGGGSSSGSGSGSGGSSGGSVTSPSGSNMLVTVTSPTKNENVDGTIRVTANATITSKTDGGISYWAIFDAGNLLWVDVRPDYSINVDLALSKGAHTIQVAAYDDSYTPSTATIPVMSSASGNTVSWHACMYKSGGHEYQGMKINAQQTITGVLQSQMFWNSNCDPTQWTDQMNDVGTPMTFGPGMGWIFYFIHRADLPGVSAVWTLGNQTSGCVNYNTAPACY